MTTKNTRSANGFTIVELLIVIIVIAILAAISIVAYTNIQNRAHDTAVTSDLSGIGKTIDLIHASAGAYPAGGAIRVNSGTVRGTGLTVAPAGLRYRVTTGSYEDNRTDNLIYCEGPSTISGQQIYSIVAISKSNKIFRQSVASGLQEISALSTATICDGIGWPNAISYGYYRGNGNWLGWTQ